MHSLYRHFDKDGALLYVGISINVLNRLKQHKNVSHWFYEIASVTIEHLETRQAAIFAERKAIAEENPRHNLSRPSTVDIARLNLANAEKSRKELVQRIAQFNPMYSITEAAEVLRIPKASVQRLVEAGEIGSVCVGEIFRSGSAVRKLNITGWQLIDFIEHMEASSKERANEPLA